VEVSVEGDPELAEKLSFVQLPGALPKEPVEAGASAT
jgi:hypothetical protein